MKRDENINPTKGETWIFDLALDLRCSTWSEWEKAPNDRMIWDLFGKMEMLENNDG
jgi:hypothetical protein